MKLLVMFLFFLGMYMISVYHVRIESAVPMTTTPEQSRKKSQESVSDLYSMMFDKSGPWLEKFVYNHPDEPKMKEPEKAKMSLFSAE